MRVDGSVCVVYHLKFAGGRIYVCIICRVRVDGSVCVVYHLKFAGGWFCVCIICSVRVDGSVCVLSIECGWMVLCVYYL